MAAPRVSSPALVALALAVAAAWLFADYANWAFQGSYWAPDACLDVLHGSFDYNAWSCSLDEQKTFVDTPIYLVPGFSLALISFFFSRRVFGLVALLRVSATLS